MVWAYVHTHTHTHTHLFRFFSRVGCDKILSILYEHCLDLSLFFLVLPQYLFPCTFFERLKQHLTISMGHISGRCFGEFSAQGLIDCACAQFLGQCDVHIGQRLQRCLVERIQRLNMAIFANKLYFIYGEKTLKSSQKAEKWSIWNHSSFYFENISGNMSFEKKGDLDKQRGNFEACRVFPAHGGGRLWACWFYRWGSINRRDARQPAARAMARRGQACSDASGMRTGPRAVLRGSADPPWSVWRPPPRHVRPGCVSGAAGMQPSLSSSSSGERLFMFVWFYAMPKNTR